MQAYLAVILSALLMPGPANAAEAQPQIVLAGVPEVRRSAQGPWLELIYREAFRRLGYDFKYVSYPARRSAMLSDHGDVDGEIHRVSSYGKDHPTLVRVDESHFSARFSAYASRPLAMSNGWDGLRTTSYRVEYRLGNLKCESELPPRIAAERLSTVSSAALGLRKLLAGRTDLYIDGELVVEAALKSPEFRTAAIRKVAVMEQVNAHAFLIPKHKALALRLSETLAQMKREGLIEAYRITAMEIQSRVNPEPADAAQ